MALQKNGKKQKKTNSFLNTYIIAASEDIVI